MSIMRDPKFLISNICKRLNWFSIKLVSFKSSAAFIAVLLLYSPIVSTSEKNKYEEVYKVKKDEHLKALSNINQMNNPAASSGVSIRTAKQPTGLRQFYAASCGEYHLAFKKEDKTLDVSSKNLHFEGQEIINQIAQQSQQEVSEKEHIISKFLQDLRNSEHEDSIIKQPLYQPLSITKAVMREHKFSIHFPSHSHLSPATERNDFALNLQNSNTTLLQKVEELEKEPQKLREYGDYQEKDEEVNTHHEIIRVIVPQAEQLEVLQDKKLLADSQERIEESALNFTILVSKTSLLGQSTQTDFPTLEEVYPVNFTIPRNRSSLLNKMLSHHINKKKDKDLRYSFHTWKNEIDRLNKSDLFKIINSLTDLNMLSSKFKSYLPFNFQNKTQGTSLNEMLEENDKKTIFSQYYDQIEKYKENMSQMIRYFYQQKTLKEESDNSSVSIFNFAVLSSLDNIVTEKKQEEDFSLLNTYNYLKGKDQDQQNLPLNSSFVTFNNDDSLDVDNDVNQHNLFYPAASEDRDTKRIEKYRKNKNRYQREIDNQREHNRHLSLHLIENNKKYTQSHARYKSLSSDFNKLQNQYKSLNIDLMQMYSREENHLETIKSLKDIRDKKNSEIYQLREQQILLEEGICQNNKIEFSLLKKEITELQRDKECLENTLNSFDQDIKWYTKNEDILKERIGEYEKFIRIAEDKIHILTYNTQNKDLELKSLQENNDFLYNEINNREINFLKKHNQYEEKLSLVMYAWEEKKHEIGIAKLTNIFLRKEQEYIMKKIALNNWQHFAFRTLVQEYLDAQDERKKELSISASSNFMIKRLKDHDFHPEAKSLIDDFELMTEKAKSRIEDDITIQTEKFKDKRKEIRLKKQGIFLGKRKIFEFEKADFFLKQKIQKQCQDSFNAIKTTSLTNKLLKELMDLLSKAYNHSYKVNILQMDKLPNLEKERTYLINENLALKDELSEMEFFKFYTDQLKASVYILEDKIKELKAKPKSSFEILTEGDKESFSLISYKKVGSPVKKNYQDKEYIFEINNGYSTNIIKCFNLNDEINDDFIKQYKNLATECSSSTAVTLSSCDEEQPSEKYNLLIQKKIQDRVDIYPKNNIVKTKIMTNKNVEEEW